MSAYVHVQYQPVAYYMRSIRHVRVCTCIISARGLLQKHPSCPCMYMYNISPWFTTWEASVMSVYVHVQYQPVVYYMRSIRHVRVCTCTISARGLLHEKHPSCPCMYMYNISLWLTTEASVMSVYVHVQYQPVVYYMRSIRHVRVCTCTISARGLLHEKHPSCPCMYMYNISPWFTTEASVMSVYVHVQYQPVVYYMGSIRHVRVCTCTISARGLLHEKPPSCPCMYMYNISPWLTTWEASVMSVYVHVQYQPVAYYMRSIRHVRVCTCTISARGLLHEKHPSCPCMYMYNISPWLTTEASVMSVYVHVQYQPVAYYRSIRHVRVCTCTISARGLLHEKHPSCPCMYMYNISPWFTT